MVQSTKVSGKNALKRAKVLSVTLMDHNTKGTSKMTCLMVSEESPSVMHRGMSVSLHRECSMDKDSLDGLMVPSMKANGRTMK